MNLKKDKPLSKSFLIPLLKGNRVLPLELLYKEQVVPIKTRQVYPGVLLLKKPFGLVFINLTGQPKDLNREGFSLTSLSSRVIYNDEEAQRVEVLETISPREKAGLYLAQLRIFIRQKAYSERPWYKKRVTAKGDYAYHDNWQ